MGRTPNSTDGWLERDLWQRLRSLYITQLGHRPYRISYRLNDQEMTIVIEDSITRPVKILAETGKQELAKQMQINIHKAIQPQLKILIEEVVGVEVSELLDDFNVETGRTSITAVLAATPQIGTSSTARNVN